MKTNNKAKTTRTDLNTLIMAIAEINEIAKTLRPTALKSKQSPTSVMDSFISDRSESSPTLKFSE